jgi:hypothetical protein
MLKKFFSGKSSKAEPASITVSELHEQVDECIKNPKDPHFLMALFIGQRVNRDTCSQKEKEFFIKVWLGRTTELESYVPHAKSSEPNDLERLELQLQECPNHRFTRMLLDYIEGKIVALEPQSDAFYQLVDDIELGVQVCQSQNEKFQADRALTSIMTTVEGIQQSRQRPQLTAQLSRAESDDSGRGSSASSSTVSSPLPPRSDIGDTDSLTLDTQSIDSGEGLDEADSEPRAPSNPDTFTTPTTTPTQIPFWLQAKSDAIQADFKKDGTPEKQRDTLKDWYRTHHADRQSLTIIFPNGKQWQGLQPRSHASGQNPITDDDLSAFRESCTDNKGTKQQAQFLLNHGKIGQLQGMGLLGLKHFVQNTDGHFFVDDPSTESAITFQLLKDGNIAYTEQLTASVVDDQETGVEETPNYAITLRCKALISLSKNTITWQEVESTGTDELYAAVEPVRRSTQLQYFQEARVRLSEQFQNYRQQFGEIDTRGLVEISQYQAAQQQIDEIAVLLERPEDDNEETSEHLINSRVALEQAMKQLPQMTTVREAVKQAIKDFSQQLQDQHESLLQQVGYHEQALKAITMQAGNTIAISESSNQLEAIRSTSSIDLTAANLATEHQKLQQAQQQLGQLPSISQVAQAESSRKQTALIADLKQWHTAIGRDLEKFKQVTSPDEQHRQYRQVIDQLDDAKKQANSLMTQAQELRYGEISGDHFESLKTIQQHFNQLQSVAAPTQQKIADLVNLDQVYRKELIRLSDFRNRQMEREAPRREQAVERLLRENKLLDPPGRKDIEHNAKAPIVTTHVTEAKNKFDVLKQACDSLVPQASRLIHKDKKDKQEKLAAVINTIVPLATNDSTKGFGVADNFNAESTFAWLRQLIDGECKSQRLRLSDTDKNKLTMLCMLQSLSQTLATSKLCDYQSSNTTYHGFLPSCDELPATVEKGERTLNLLSRELTQLRSSSLLKRIFNRPSLFRQQMTGAITHEQKRWATLQGAHNTYQKAMFSVINSQQTYQRKHNEDVSKAQECYSELWSRCMQEGTLDRQSLTQSFQQSYLHYVPTYDDQHPVHEELKRESQNKFKELSTWCNTRFITQKDLQDQLADIDLFKIRNFSFEKGTASVAMVRMSDLGFSKTKRCIIEARQDGPENQTKPAGQDAYIVIGEAPYMVQADYRGQPVGHTPLVTPKNSLVFAEQPDNGTTIPAEEITCAQ